MTGRERLLAALQWIAGPQRWDGSPDSRDRGRVVEKGWARDAGGGFLALTDEGQRLLEELVDGRENRDALRLALSTSATYAQARRVLELSGDYATALAWIVARQADGRAIEPEEPLE